MMDKKKTCKYCKWWDHYCRRRAPVVAQGMDGHGITAWPRTDPWDWCGEWEKEQSK